MSTNDYLNLPPTSGGTSGVSSLNSLTGALSIAAGSGISVTPAGSTITIAATGAGSGTVTSVAMTVPTILSVSGSPITTSGTLAVTLASQSANLFLGSPNGSSGTPTFRAVNIATADITGNLPVTNLNSGTSASSSTFWRGDGTWAAAGGGGADFPVNTDITSMTGLTGYLQAPVGVKDLNGNIVQQWANPPSAVNYLVITGSATGNAPSFAATGSDTNVGLTLSTKGTGALNVNAPVILLDSTTPVIEDFSGNSILAFFPTGSAVNAMSLSNASTTNAPIMAPVGSDTNIGMQFIPKGSGINTFLGGAQVQTNTVSANYTII